MKRLTTLALLAGMLSAPTLHSEETPADALPQLNFPLSGAEADGASAAEANSPAATEHAPANVDQPASLPAMPPSVAAGIPDTVPLTPIVGGNLNLTQMGMPDGIILSGGQNQGGASFTLPSDQVVTHAQLMLEVKVSPEMAARNATLQLMLNGQPLGTLPLGADGEEISHYQLDIPAALMVSSNNLSFKINDGDA
ncbi:MAG: cellulose biosynthesis cyclic di-GMP-binding regulatory protein BcsB, partial [Klebsiella michiganensis]|nr:cellulose biosynthesis cyclic di-GMP-binding regulatory protein BcsB [Klebsiella michiganensis]